MKIEKRYRPWDDDSAKFSELYEVEVPLFSFTHSYRTFEQVLHVSKKSFARSEKADYTAFLMYDISGKRLGFSSGYLFREDGKIIFEANVTRNEQRDLGYAHGYLGNKTCVPRVVAASIGEVIKRGIVDVWYSSYDLLPEGIRMYDGYLCKDQNIYSKAYTFENGQGYVLARRKIDLPL